MEYKHSVVVDPSTYKTEGLCDGIPLRMHAHSDLENIGIIRAQEDWSRLAKNVDNCRGDWDQNTVSCLFPFQNIF